MLHLAYNTASVCVWLVFGTLCAISRMKTVCIAARHLAYTKAYISGLSFILVVHKSITLLEALFLFIFYSVL